MTDKDKLFIQLQHEAANTPEIELVMLPTQYRLYDRITGEIVGFARLGKWDIRKMLKTYTSYIRDYKNNPSAPIEYSFYLDLPRARKVYFEIEVVNGRVWANYCFDKNMEDVVRVIIGINNLYEIIEDARRYCPEDNIILCESYSDKVLTSEVFNEYNTYISTCKNRNTYKSSTIHRHF